MPGPRLSGWQAPASGREGGLSLRDSDRESLSDSDSRLGTLERLGWMPGRAGGSGPCSRDSDGQRREKGRERGT